MSDPTTPENTTGQPLTPANIKTINQLPHLDDIDPDDVILVQDVSQNTYRKSSLQAVVDRMNPLQSVNLTQAEYDALPESEKLNGTYYNITDDSPPPYQLYLDATMPIGFVYEQLPPTLDEDGNERTPLDPNALFNNGYVHSVWKRLDYDGAFFRADGTGALPFGTGVQLDALQGHNHQITNGVGWFEINYGSTSSSAGGKIMMTGSATTNNMRMSDDGVNGEPRIADETRPKNLTVIKWIRVE